LHSNALFALNEWSIDQVEQSGVAFLNAYLAKLLQWSGSQPQLSGCLQCGLSLFDLPLLLEVSCLIADAGWVCEKCRDQETRHIRERNGNAFQHSLLRLTAAAIQDFQMSLRTPIRMIFQSLRASPREHRALFQFLEALYVFHIPGFDQKPLKGLRFLELESTVRLEGANPR
jgi:recombinational DNA repair protein (RecF pathway)